MGGACCGFSSSSAGCRKQLNGKVLLMAHVLVAAVMMWGSAASDAVAMQLLSGCLLLSAQPCVSCTRLPWSYRPCYVQGYTPSL